MSDSTDTNLAFVDELQAKGRFDEDFAKNFQETIMGKKPDAETTQLLIKLYNEHVLPAYRPHIAGDAT